MKGVGRGRTRVARWLAAGALLGLALALCGPTGRAYSLLGFSLGLDQRDLRVFDNFLDPSANDNQVADGNWPGAVGAELALWKAAAEWGSAAFGTGGGDPTQAQVGDGGANFDVTWQGAAPGVGSSTENVVSAIGGGTGVLAFTEFGSTGWRTRFDDSFLWDDGPGSNLVPGAFDLQGVFAHEFGHALGLGHSTVPGATMSPIVAGNGLPARSIEADDVAAVQAVYGVAAASKPVVSGVVPGAVLTITGSGFHAASSSVWFTRAGGSPDGTPLKVGGLAASAGGTVLTLALPAGVGAGALLVEVPGGGGAALSNSFPFDPLVGCGASPQVYCTAKVNSLGCTPAVAFAGTPSASAGTGFVITAGNVLNRRNGLLFYGKNGPSSAPFQGGFLCARQPLRRTPIQNSGGSAPPASDCTGQLGLDFNLWVAGGADPSLVAGQPVWAQFWSRDPASPSTTNLTDAVEFVLCP